jgi:hypothetical protein
VEQGTIASKRYLRSAADLVALMEEPHHGSGKPVSRNPSREEVARAR